MKVKVSPLAEKQLRKLSKVNQIIVAEKIRKLAARQEIKQGQLTGYKNIFCVRIGNLRIVYKKSKTRLYIILIGHRRDVYEKLKRLFG